MEKSGIPYFSLLCQPDNRWEEIETEYGLKGFGILVKLYQRIYSSGYYIKWTKETEQAFSQKMCGLPKDSGLVSALVKTALRRGLFSNALFEKYRILTSEEVQEQYLRAVVKRKDVQMKEAYLLVQFAQIPSNVDIIREKEEKNSEKSTTDMYSNTNTDSKEKNIKLKYSTSSGQEPDKAASLPKEETGQPIYTLPLSDKSLHPISQEQVSHWRQLYPEVDILQELRLMRGWLESNPAKGKEKKTISRFITNWLIDRQKKTSQPSQAAAPKPVYQTRFVNYEQRQWDFEELARLERKRLKERAKEYDQ